MDRVRKIGDPGRTSADFRRISLKKILWTMAALVLGYVLLMTYLHFKGDAELRQLFGGAAGWSTLKDAQRIEAYRIGPIADEIKWQDAGLSDFPILSGPAAVSESDVQTLKNTLQDRNSYDWNARKGCVFQPGVRLDFTHDEDQLSVLLCFECDTLETFRNGKLVSGQNFDYVRPILVRVARQLFPDDPKIQSLLEKR